MIELDQEDLLAILTSRLKLGNEYLDMDEAEAMAEFLLDSEMVTQETMFANVTKKPKAKK